MVDQNRNIVGLMDIATFCHCRPKIEKSPQSSGELNPHEIKKMLEDLLSGTLSNSEKEQLRDYIGSSYQDKDLNDLMLKHWQRLDDKSASTDEANLQSIKLRLLSFIDKDKQVVKAPIQKSRKLWINYLSRAAAVLFIPLLIVSAYLFYNLNQKGAFLDKQVVMQEVVASPGSRVHFTLPDQSEVWLNSESKLEFSMGLNNEKQRLVKLTGQGYFKVAHDKKRPFLVETNDLKFKVLGTSFDVSGYADDSYLSSTLEEGSIAVLNLKGKEMARLIPGQQAILNKDTRELLVENVDTKLSTSWKDGQLIFKNTPFNDVLNQLERWFNCEIEAAPEILNSGLQYSATIQDETLGEVLEMMEISTSVKTEIKNRNVTIWNN